MASWFIVCDNEAELKLVLEEKRVPFRTDASNLAKSDRCVVYASKNAWGHPNKDEPQVIAIGKFLGAAEKTPVTLGEETIEESAKVEITAVQPERLGMPLKPLVVDLWFVRKKATWWNYVRKPVISIPEQDFETIAIAFMSWTRSHPAP